MATAAISPQSPCSSKRPSNASEDTAFKSKVEELYHEDVVEAIHEEKVAEGKQTAAAAAALKKKRARFKKRDT